MTGPSLAPPLIVRPHSAQTVLPSPFSPALPFAGRARLFRWRGIETESHSYLPMDGLFFLFLKRSRQNILPEQLRKDPGVVKNA